MKNLFRVSCITFVAAFLDSTPVVAQTKSGSDTLGTSSGAGNIPGLKEAGEKNTTPHFAYGTTNVDSNGNYINNPNAVRLNNSNIYTGARSGTPSNTNGRN